MAGWIHIATTLVAPTNTEDTFARFVCPLNTVEHDLMVVAVACELEGFGSAAAAISGPSGWTKAEPQEDLAVGGNGPTLAIFHKLATASDVAGSTTYDFTWTHAATGRVGAITTYRGVHRTNPFEAIVSGETTSGAVSTGNTAPENATDLAHCAFVVMHTAARTFTPGGSDTERADGAGNGTGGDDFLSLAITDIFAALAGSHTVTVSDTYTAAIGEAAIFRRNPSPNTPVVPAPTNFDATTEQTWTHEFSDDMPGDVQTFRQWHVYKVSDGSLAYDTGEVETASLETIIPPDTLANGNQYQRQVRVRDIDGNASAFSPLQSFVTSAPPTATITSPATDVEVVESSSHTITWDYSDPEAKAQSAYRTVVDRTDVPGTLLDTGEVLSSAAGRAVTGLQDGGSYSIEQLVRDADGIWSAVATRTFTVDYAQPPKPLVDVTDAGHFLRVTITNPTPTGEEVVAASNDLFRRETGGEWVRIAAETAVNVIYDDYAVASGVDYEYKATAYTGTGGAMDSDPSSGSVVLELTWLHDPADVSTAWGVDQHTRERGDDWSAALTLHKFAGRTDPVAEFGDTEDRSVRFTLFLHDSSPEDLVALRALAALKTTLCYRDNYGRKVFGVLGPLAVTDAVKGRHIPLVFTATSYSEDA